MGSSGSGWLTSGMRMFAKPLSSGGIGSGGVEGTPGTSAVDAWRIGGVGGDGEEATCARALLSSSS